MLSSLEYFYEVLCFFLSLELLDQILRLQIKAVVKGSYLVEFVVVVQGRFNNIKFTRFAVGERKSSNAGTLWSGFNNPLTTRNSVTWSTAQADRSGSIFLS